MTTESFPAFLPTGLLTAADLSFEPEDGLGRELHDGVMHVVPPPIDDHQMPHERRGGSAGTHS